MYPFSAVSGDTKGCIQITSTIPPFLPITLNSSHWCHLSPHNHSCCQLCCNIIFLSTILIPRFRRCLTQMRIILMIKDFKFTRRVLLTTLFHILWSDQKTSSFSHLQEHCKINTQMHVKEATGSIEANTVHKMLETEKLYSGLCHYWPLT